MTNDLRLQDLSDRAQRGLLLALGDRPLTLDSVRQLRQRDIWILEGFGRMTSNEIKTWAARHGVEMPE
jgi:hypothetical protein